MARASDSPHEESASLDPPKPKVIYVMGQPKSGSTILGVTLGNCRDVFFAGELCNWLVTSGRPTLGGEERVSFWQEVRKDVQAPDDAFGTDTYQYLERGRSAFKPDGHRKRHELRGSYRSVTAELFRSVAARASATHVVDTSHLPLRARELQDVAGIDLYLILLVRDVESIVASQTRSANRRDAAPELVRLLRVNGRVWWTYLLSVVVFFRQPREKRILLRHEDFIAHPEEVMRELLDFVGAPPELPDFAQLQTGVPLNGNRLIRTDVVSLNRRAIPAHRSSRLIKLVQRPWARLVARLEPAADGQSAHNRPQGD